MLVSGLIQKRTLKSIQIYKKTVLTENHINREIKTWSSQFSYTDVMNNMKLLEVLTTPSIYQKETADIRSMYKQ